MYPIVYRSLLIISRIRVIAFVLFYAALEYGAESMHGYVGTEVIGTE